jgi:hypothetical protein
MLVSGRRLPGPAAELRNLQGARCTKRMVHHVLLGL